MMLGTHELRIEGSAEDVYAIFGRAAWDCLHDAGVKHSEELANRILTRVELRLTAAGLVTRQIDSAEPARLELHQTPAADGD